MGRKLPGLLFAAVSPQGWTLSGLLQTQVCRTRGREVRIRSSSFTGKAVIGNWKERQVWLNVGQRLNSGQSRQRSRLLFPVIRTVQQWMGCHGRWPACLLEDVLWWCDGWWRSCWSAPLRVIWGPDPTDALPLVYVLDTQLCLTLCNLMDCSPPSSSVQGIIQARILEWVAISFSRGSSWLRDGTHVSCIAGRFFLTSEPPGSAAKEIWKLRKSI